MATRLGASVLQVNPLCAGGDRISSSQPALLMAASGPLRTFNPGASGMSLSERCPLRCLALRCASRQAARGAGASCGGQPCGLTTLRCSPRGGAAKLATRAVPAALGQLRRASSRSALRAPPSRLRCSAPHMAPAPRTACRSRLRCGVRAESPPCWLQGDVRARMGQTSVKGLDRPLPTLRRRAPEIESRAAASGAACGQAAGRCAAARPPLPRVAAPRR